MAEDTLAGPPVPAAQLEGLVLANGWKVVGQLVRGPGATGGVFSHSYTVAHQDGRTAFLKALDFHAALTGPGDLIDRMERFTSAYQFERDLLRDCALRRLSRVIRLIDYGEAYVPGAGVLARVPYLIFELADGDIRVFQQQLNTFDAAWVMRVLKHTTQGVEQLHYARVAHQDLKPSNILTQRGGQEMKLGDLGRAERLGVDGPASGDAIPGAVAYAPPEQLYGAFSRTWEERRAGDMYLLGSLGVQLILGHSLTALLQASLAKPFRAGTWSERFASVLPYLMAGHEEVMARVQSSAGKLIGDNRVTEELVVALRQMTIPDPSLRGHPRDRAAQTSSHDVRRYVSLFDRLSRTLEYNLRGNR